MTTMNPISQTELFCNLSEQDAETLSGGCHHYRVSTRPVYYHPYRYYNHRPVYRSAVRTPYRPNYTVAPTLRVNLIYN